MHLRRLKLGLDQFGSIRSQFVLSSADARFRKKHEAEQKKRKNVTCASETRLPRDGKSNPMTGWTLSVEHGSVFACNFDWHLRMENQHRPANLTIIT